MGMPPQVMEMMASMKALSQRKPIAAKLVKEAMDLLEKARDLDPKVEERISHALAVLRGEEEEVGAGNPFSENGSTSRRSAY